METRQLIGQAVGLLMVRQDMSEADALDALRRASQRLNIKLRQLAESIVHPPAGAVDRHLPRGAAVDGARSIGTFGPDTPHSSVEV